MCILRLDTLRCILFYSSFYIPIIYNEDFCFIKSKGNVAISLDQKQIHSLLKLSINIYFSKILRLRACGFVASSLHFNICFLGVTSHSTVRSTPTCTNLALGTHFTIPKKVQIIFSNNVLFELNCATMCL